MNKRFTLALCLGLVFSVSAASDVRAQYGQGYGGYGGYGAFDVGQLYRVLAQNVPYYAAFPPVYYSAPVPRTYGYSPFAYPPGTMTPEIVAVVPLEISNPHVPTPAVAPAENEDSDKTTRLEIRPEPLVVMNPYVVGRDAENSLASFPVTP
ncbi:MAG: hypothetical protein GXP26_17365 [Planctomycetes bacterium]|nr:hypothetical protein [Planctomycetota bacterium]